MNDNTNTINLPDLSAAILDRLMAATPYGLEDSNLLIDAAASIREALRQHGQLLSDVRSKDDRIVQLVNLNEELIEQRDAVTEQMLQSNAEVEIHRRAGESLFNKSNEAKEEIEKLRRDYDAVVASRDEQVIRKNAVIQSKMEALALARELIIDAEIDHDDERVEKLIKLGMDRFEYNGYAEFEVRFTVAVRVSDVPHNISTDQLSEAINEVVADWVHLDADSFTVRVDGETIEVEVEDTGNCDFDGVELEAE